MSEQKNSTASVSAMQCAPEAPVAALEPVVFDSPLFGRLRAVVKDGEPWFLLHDVCAAMQTRTNDAMASLDADERGYDTIVSPGGNQRMAIASEAGLYSLILRARAGKLNEERAQRVVAFRRWVTHDVLPALRTRGTYTMPGALPADPRALALPDFRNPGEAARAWAIQYDRAEAAEAKAALESARADEAVRTKAEIGSRREATAMATASAAVKRAVKAEGEAAELRDRLGEGEAWRTARAVSWLPDFLDMRRPGAWSAVGKALASISRELNLEIRRADRPDGAVNMYAVEAVDELRSRLQASPAVLADFRRKPARRGLLDFLKGALKPAPAA